MVVFTMALPSAYAAYQGRPVPIQSLTAPLANPRGLRPLPPRGCESRPVRRRCAILAWSGQSQGSRLYTDVLNHG
jgi:hypothetical protein